MKNDWDIDQGDKVLVRVRENGTSSRIVAKFEARVEGFQGSVGPGSEYVRLSPPWNSTTGVKLRNYEAEFEVIEE